jgi:hypothetical protein
MNFRSSVLAYGFEVLQSNKPLALRCELLALWRELLALWRELLALRRELPQKGVQEPKDLDLVENGGSAT